MPPDGRTITLKTDDAKRPEIQVPVHHKEIKIAEKPKRPDLTSRPVHDKRAKRTWSQAYLTLTSRGKCTALVNWISPQSAPPMLPPYHAGAAKSKLVHMLEAGHNKVKLSAEEMARIACWIDLLVPCFGDYAERYMDPKGKAKYLRYLAKRKKWQAQERKNIAAFLRDGSDGSMNRRGREGRGENR